MENANRIVAEGIAAIEAATDSNALELVKARYLGKTWRIERLVENPRSNVTRRAQNHRRTHQ